MQPDSIVLPPHVLRRMEQRGVSRTDIIAVLSEGWPGGNPRPGASGRVRVFLLEAEWEGRHYREKEVTVYYRETEKGFVVLTAIVRYGADFPRGHGEL